jgi:hypothetical protein
MSDVTGCDVNAKERLVENAEARMCSWQPKRFGEVVRVCAACGAEFEPRSRNQKYCCKECRPSNQKEQEKA